MSDNIKVVVKVRPLICREIEEKLSYQWRVNNNTLYQLDQNGKELGVAFTFDKVYDKDTETSDVYNDIAKPIVEAATAGINGTIFAYGQTSSGKTYTMTGTEDSPGIIQMAILNLFDIIKNIPDRDFLVRVSYIEIYNETLKDLLDIEKDNLKIHESLQGIKVDATEKVASSPEEVLDTMKQGEANRQTGATNMNEKSSRSHTIFQIIIESREHVEGEEEVGSVNVSQLNLVDLAGSERAGQTGATGIRFKEGTLINKSLSALALVIKQLSEDSNKYTNYRDSKLTRILQNSLGGNAKTSIICAVTPAAVEETISTLQFANRAKAIKNKPEVNAVATNATMIQTLTEQLSKLKHQLKNKKKLEVLLASKRNVEQTNYNLQKQIAALQKLIINAFDQRSSVDAVTSRRKNPPRRFTISNLHAIEEDAMPEVPKFSTPALKYNPMCIPGVSELVPIQEPRNLSSLPEESNRSVTPTMDKKVNFDDEVIVLDSDDESSGQPCSPYHKCYDTKTPPCILRKNAQVAEENLRDIVELTEREKIYSPEVHELMDKLENYDKVIIKLKDEIEELTEQSKIKDIEVEQLMNKIKNSEEQIQNITDIKTNLEAQCNNYNIKLTDWEFSYETLKKSAKRREEELLSFLSEQSLKNTNSTGSISKNIEYDNFIDLSKDLTLTNSSHESSSNQKNDEYSSVNVKIVMSDLQAQLDFKNQKIFELESNFDAQKEKIELLENSSHELQSRIDIFKEKLANVETENSLLKITIGTLNSTIKSQHNSLDIAHKDMENIEELRLDIAHKDMEDIEELQIRFTNKENITNINVNDTILDTMLQNEERFLANNENIRNIIYSFKTVLEKRNQEIKDLKATDTVHLKQDIQNKTKYIENLNDDIHKLQEQVKENIATINKLLREKNNLITLEKDLTRELHTAQKLNTELKVINDKNLKEIAALKEINEVLLLQETNSQAEEQKVNDMVKQIANMEKDIKQKDDLIAKLKTEDATTQEHLDKANVVLSKLKNVIKMLTGDIEDVPEVIDNFVNVFNMLCNSLNALESSAANIMSQKEEAIKDLLELQEKYDEMCKNHNERTKNLCIQIDNHQENEKSLMIINENLSQQLKELTTKVAINNNHIKTITNENSTLQLQLSKLSDENLNLKNCLSSKEIIISALKENEVKLLSSLNQTSHTESTNIERDIQNLKAIIESKEELFKKLLKLKEEKISELSSNLKLIENSVNAKCYEIFCLHEKHNEVLNDRDYILKQIYEKVCFLSKNLNLSNSFFDEFKDNDMNEIIVLILDKITNYVKDSRNRNSPQRNYYEILTETQKQVRELSMQNINLINKLSLIEENNLQVINEIQTIQSDNIDLVGDLTTGNTLLEHLQQELKLKHDEFSQMVEKVTDWKNQFVTLDITMKNHMDELILENENIKMRCDDLKNNTEENIKHLIEKSFDEYSSNNHDKVSKDIITTEYSPKSLLTLCCSTIVDHIQPKDSKSEDVTPSYSYTDMEVPRVATPEKKCACDKLSAKLNMIQYEKTELTNTINHLKLVNYKLKNELEEVRREVQLLLEPVYELQKKIIGHRTNLSILTATTYAENKSLISQVKGFQHHHNRFHNVCQRDIPAFKRQLCELLAILKDSTLDPASQNANLKRCSLPDVFDNNNTLNNLKNESTLVGDLLMLDTNVTLTTADNTLVGCDQTCLDLNQSLYNEVSCQTNEINVSEELKLQMEYLSNDNENMIDLLEILKEENIKLREQVDIFSKEKPCGETVSLNEKETIKFSNICEKCIDLDTLKIKLKNIESEYKDISQQFSEFKNQNKIIEQKYNVLKLEVLDTDEIVKKLHVLEKDCDMKANEITKLANALRSKSEQLQFLQEENITLSTQVMENISETDDLNKELNKLKQQNVELVENLNEMERDKYKYEDIKCTQCDLKNNIIFTLPAKSISGTHTKQKLNRSYSDSDTSSRYNKICTLQSELNAGREDCKELTEDFTTIKNHLERSNLSMDLDESMGEARINSHSVEYLPRSPQSNTCIMPDIPEEHPLDVYVIDKTECLNYYIEKTGTKTDLDSTVKIIDIMKMFYDNLVVRHGDEMENLLNKLKDYEESYSQLQIKMSNITCENVKITQELKEKRKDSESLARVISQLKDNITIIMEEREQSIEPNKTTVVNLFKEKLLKIIDTKFELSSLNLFSFIDNIINKNEHDLNEALQNYNNLQENMLKVKLELDSAHDDLTKLKSQLNDKEDEYKLLKVQKEKIHEISNAVTLDIIKKEQTLNEIISKHFQKLVELDIIDSKGIDKHVRLNDTVDFLLEHLLALLNKRSTDREDKQKLDQEIQHLKTVIDYNEKVIVNLKMHNGELLEIIEKTNVTLTEKTNKYYELNTLHEELNKVYNSKVEENNMNSSLIEKLTEENEILKKNIIQHKATVHSLSEKEDSIRDLMSKIKELQEDNSRLKSANEFINREKDAYALELEESSKTIKKNNAEHNRMTLDILELRESIKNNITIIETLKEEAKLLLKQNLELKEQFEGKCQDCARLEMNIKTHEKTAEIQNRIIIRLQKQKDELDLLIGQKDKLLEEINAKCTTLQNDFEELSKTKESLEVRVTELELEEKSNYKPRTSIDRIVESARRRRQSLHDSKRIFADDKINFEDINNLESSTLERRQKTDEDFMDINNESNRSTPNRLSKGRDSLQSRTDQSERDDEHSSRPGSVLATRKRRQSSHDLHRSVVQTPTSSDHPTVKLGNELNTSKNSETSCHNDSNLLQLREKLASCLKELEDLKEKYKELDDECEICAEYLHEREDQCIRLKEEKATIEAQLVELKEKMQSNILNQNECKRDVAHVSVNTDEDWTKLHSVVVDRMSYDAEVDKNKRLVKVIEELRYSKQDLQNTLAKMQRALEKFSGKDNRELEATRMELQQRNEELEELRQRYKELDEECDTCAQYLKEREEQCLRLKEAKAALEAKLRDIQDENASEARVQSARKKRQSMHDLNRQAVVEFTDASTEIGDDFLSNQVDRDENTGRATNETPSRELKRLKQALDVLTHQKAALEIQLASLSTIPLMCPPMYVATGSAIVQNQQLSDAMKENQKLKKINAKLINICKKRGKSDANRENEDPSDQG